MIGSRKLWGPDHRALHYQLGRDRILTVTDETRDYFQSIPVATESGLRAGTKSPVRGIADHEYW